MSEDEYVNSAKIAKKSDYYIDIHLMAKRNSTPIGKIKTKIRKAAKNGMFHVIVNMNEDERSHFIKKGFDTMWTEKGYVISWR